MLINVIGSCKLIKFLNWGQDHSRFKQNIVA